MPLDDAALASNVRHALTLGLLEPKDVELPFHEPITIIANGPSARDAPLTGPTCALNGALQLFTEKGLAPTYWAACDPQEMVADFVPDDPPEETVYLVASKCHPRVFEKLAGRKVVLWHVSDDATWDLVKDRQAVLAWVSVTLCTPELLARLGWRQFHIYGWDGCYIDGADHAVGQAHKADNIEIGLGDRAFPTTTTWALEAQTACTALAGFPFPIHVHGSGFVPALLKHFLSRRVMTDPGL